jgi:hypothetical protein
MAQTTLPEGGIGTAPTTPTTSTVVLSDIASTRPVASAGVLGGGANKVAHPQYGLHPVNPRQFNPPSTFPAWAQSLTENKATPEQLVRAALDRVSKDHSEQTVVEAQAVINELARSADHAKVATSVLTPDAVKALVAKKPGA